MKARERHYHVVALAVPIVYDFEGDHDPDGRIYALEGYRDQNGSYHDLSERIACLKELARDFPRDRPEVQLGSDPLRPHPLVRPLVLRACKGERLIVHFRNEIDELPSHGGNHEVHHGGVTDPDHGTPDDRDDRLRAGLHILIDGYDVKTSDGADVGWNVDSTVLPRESTVYTYDLADEGVFPFHDMGNLDGEERGTNAHGLFGTLVVEPEGWSWTDPETGAPLIDGLSADVHPPAPCAPDRRDDPQAALWCSFREFVVIFHDEPEVDFPFARRYPAPTCSDDPEAAFPMFMPINYRAETMTNRLIRLEMLKARNCLKTRVEGEEQHHSSWLFGDPATPVLRCYRNDPVRIRLAHAGVKETHVFHLHVHTWYAVPENPKSTIIDSISIGPQSGQTIIPLHGAGSRQGVTGDAIFHCHLYPHFHQGMWGILRTHDVLEDGTREYPHYTDPDDPCAAINQNPVLRITSLVPLPGRPEPPAPTEDLPGFPFFIAGEYGQKSPLPPWVYGPDFPEPIDGIASGYRPPSSVTNRERSRLIPDPFLGEAFTEIGPRREADRHFDIVVLSRDIVYNGDGWHDPIGHFFALAEDEEAIRAGKKPIVPLFFRFNRGEVARFRLINKLPRRFPGDKFDCPIPLDNNAGAESSAECGLHVHLVRFDPLVSDGSSVGWNYLSGIEPGHDLYYRWHADEEFGTVFFHDHLFANFRQKHGLFGAAIVEPAGSEHLCPRTLEPLEAGTQAVIRPPSGPAFREFCLAVADFVPLYDGDVPLNPPAFPGSHDDHGVMAVNYRCEPLRERPGDPAHWFSSVDHDDPWTPIFETYPGDPIRLRLIQGSHEEQHSFVVHAMRWHQWHGDPDSPLRNQQTIGISEAFSFHVDGPHGPGDYLWHFGSTIDLWLGCWGLIRAHAEAVDDLAPLLGGSGGSPPGDVSLPPFDPHRARCYQIVARKADILYREPGGTGEHRPGIHDNFGLVYQLAGQAPSTGPAPYEPLVLRCRAGEWVEVTLTNELCDMRPEPCPPELPVESDGGHEHENGDEPEGGHDPRPRIVSDHASIHCDLLRYDVREYDGTFVGRNPDRTVGPGLSRTYRWYADRELGVVLLRDFADVRNHLHHGLIGALVVEPADATPMDPTDPKAERWHGPEAVIRRPKRTPARELVLILQDGLRLVDFDGVPLPDPVDTHFLGAAHNDPFARGKTADSDCLHATVGIGGEDAEGSVPGHPLLFGVDAEDQGRKAVNYRSEPLDWPNPDFGFRVRRLDLETPATPLWVAHPGEELWLRLVVAADRPRNHSFTVHDHSWPVEPPHVADGPRTGSIGALATASVRTLILHAGAEGDYAYRSGVYRWTLGQGLWGIIRVIGGP